MNELTKPEPSGSVYVSSTEMVVPYRPFAELERWVAYRMSEKSEKKNRLVMGFLLAFAVLGGPVFVLQVVHFILASLAVAGAGTASAAALQAELGMLVVYFYTTLITLATTAAAVYLAAPTHLSLSDSGVRFLWQRSFFGLMSIDRASPRITWDKISRVLVAVPPGKPNPHNQQLVLMGGSNVLMRLRLAAFGSMENRAHVLEAIERWAPLVARDAAVVAALEPPADYSYTEVWMKALSAPPKRERLKPLPEGAILREGKYRIVGPLGVGGQGTAYLAYDISTDERQTVVLKEFILPVYVDITVRKQALDKFENEAKILKQLDHDQIVKLTDFFVEDHRGYLVLEHIDGESLRQKVEREGKLSENAVRDLALQMCEILSYLHGLTPAVVHRDFTPDNLILRNDGKLKLVDFNVAQQTESTATGTVVGKHAYLPPEQFRGQPTTLSDIYAMGATLFYLLTGQDPEPISESHPRDLEPSVSQDMDLVVAHTTQIDPGSRYQTAEEIARFLRNARLTPTS